MATIEQTKLDLQGTQYLPLLEYWTFDAESRGLSHKTIQSYWENCHTLFRYLLKCKIDNPENILPKHIKNWIIFMLTPEKNLSKPKNILSAHTINCRIRHWKAFFRVLHRDEVLPHNPMEPIRPVKAPKRVKHTIPPGAITKVLKHLQRKRTFHGQRNRMMILVFWDCMIRLSELIGLTTSAILWDQSLIRVIGKGDKERMVPMSDITRRNLHKYAQTRGKLPGTALFCTTRGERLKERNVHRMLGKLDQVAGHHLAPHLIRHSAATNYATQPGAQVAVLQKILGHESLVVTQQYLHISAEACVSAFEGYSPAKSLRL